MDPVLFAFELPVIGKVTFPSYFTLLTVGFAFATLLTWRDAKGHQIDPDRVIDINLYMVIFGVIGARVMHLIADGHFMEYVNMCFAPETVHAVGNVPTSCTADAQCAPYFLCNVAAGHCHPPRDCLLALKVWRGGLAYYGGFIFAVAFAFYYIRKHRLPFWRIADLAGYAIPLGLFWGRLGCFLNGCCFGKVTHGHFGVTFPKGGARPPSPRRCRSTPRSSTSRCSASASSPCATSSSDRASGSTARSSGGSPFSTPSVGSSSSSSATTTAECSATGSPPRSS